MPRPAACTGPDGEMFYSWDQGRHHLELEIFCDCTAEFFYIDRDSKCFWGEDYVIEDPFSDDIKEKIALFFKLTK